MKSKACFKCGVDKPLASYYKHKKMMDGHLNKCKDCTKKDSKANHDLKSKDPKWVESEKERHRKKYHRLEYKDKHKPTPEKKKEIMDRYKSKYPEKVLAKNRVSSSKRAFKGSHLHHWSYNEEHFKDVIEMNEADHNIVHRHITYDQERRMYRIANNNVLGSGLLLDTREKSIEFYKELGVTIYNERQ